MLPIPVLFSSPPQTFEGPLQRRTNEVPQSYFSQLFSHALNYQNVMHCFLQALECCGQIFFTTLYTPSFWKASALHVVTVQSTLERFLRSLDKIFIWFIYCFAYNRHPINVCLMNINLILSDFRIYRTRGSDNTVFLSISLLLVSKKINEITKEVFIRHFTLVIKWIVECFTFLLTQIMKSQVESHKNREI